MTLSVFQGNFPIASLSKCDISYLWPIVQSLCTCRASCYLRNVMLSWYVVVCHLSQAGILLKCLFIQAGFGADSTLSLSYTLLWRSLGNFEDKSSSFGTLSLTVYLRPSAFCWISQVLSNISFIWLTVASLSLWASIFVCNTIGMTHSIVQLISDS